MQEVPAQEHEAAHDEEALTHATHALSYRPETSGPRAHGDGSSAVRWRNPGPRPLPAIEAWTDMWQTHMLARSPAARDQDYFPGGGRPGMHTANCASGAGPGAAGHFLGSSARLEPPRRVGPSHDPRSRAAETVRLFAN